MNKENPWGRFGGNVKKLCYPLAALMLLAFVPYSSGEELKKYPLLRQQIQTQSGSQPETFSTATNIPDEVQEKLKNMNDSQRSSFAKGISNLMNNATNSGRVDDVRYYRSLLDHLQEIYNVKP